MTELIASLLLINWENVDFISCSMLVLFSFSFLIGGVNVFFFPSVLCFSQAIL